MPLPRWWIGCFAALAVAGSAHGLLRMSRAEAASDLTYQGRLDQYHFQLPEQIMGWKQLNEAPEEKKAEVLGVKSSVFYFEKNGVIVSLAIDYPFIDYHDVTVCYVASGWSVVDSKSERTFGDSGQPVTLLSFTKPGLSRAEVISANVLSSGEWVDPLMEQSRRNLSRSFRDRIMGKEAEVQNLPQFRVQILWTGFSPMLPDDRTQMEALYDAARVELSKQVTGTKLEKP